MKGFPVVFQVTADTVFSRRILHLHFKVVTVLCRKILSYFLVAIEAFESWRAGAECVTGIALRRTGERRVGLGERSGRNLSLNPGRSEQTNTDKQERKEESPLEKSAKPA